MRISIMKASYFAHPTSDKQRLAQPLSVQRPSPSIYSYDSHSKSYIAVQQDENLEPLRIHQQLHKVVSSKDGTSSNMTLEVMASPFPVKPQSFHQALHLCIKPLQRIKYAATWLRYITPHLVEWLFIIWL
jgi:hypothetical protein